MTRTILVTGGGTGIGLAVARRFAVGGDHVIVTGRRKQPLVEAADSIGGTAVVCDAADPAAWQTVLPDLPARIDVLVNNAGGNTDFDLAEPADLAGVAAAWHANFAANVLSAVLATTAVTDRLADGGAVVSMGSIAADKGAGAYGAAKAALGSWNVDLARTLGPRGITCNVLSPGYTGGTEFFRDTLTDQRRDLLISQTATKRAGTPEDIAAVVHFLASPQARQLTGQVVNVNGGAWPTR
ncbi:MAG TPA: SDR family oxidoreductase [Pseudonocardiaceae bacterium]|jgi:3-oxoacyl-[acyl-carrier protein] reductase|nr:SDR family oxidoreductase [Pseudonocardiaceae bacterium]